MAKEKDGEYYSLHDGSGSGQDHCEAVGSSSDGSLGPTKGGTDNGGFWRSTRGQQFQFSDSLNAAYYTAKARRLPQSARSARRLSLSALVSLSAFCALCSVSPSLRSVRFVRVLRHAICLLSLSSAYRGRLCARSTTCAAV